jgi:hypothetical protein
VFKRVKRLLIFLKLKREIKNMPNVSDIVAALDGLLNAFEAVAKMTPTPKDDLWMATARAYREKFRPLFGAEETGGTEDLPQEIADAVDAAYASVGMGS